MTATKTITVTEAAYRRLKAEKKENESFSDTITRLTNPVKLSDFHGVISSETAEELRESLARNSSRE